MPDQYVLLRLQELVFEQSDAPVFAEVSMTSSHHPFTQLPAFHEGAWNHQALAETLARSKPKRGRVVFQGMTPEQYAKAVHYSLASVAQFLVRHYRRDGTILILGDHQAIKAVHRVDPRTFAHFRDVPLHMLTRDPEVHRRLLEHDFTPGINPDEAVVSMPMENLKSFFLHLLHQPLGADL
jgi:phosphoglycerol transferase MdoB-like AlkP superfamily enzyme